MKQPLENRTKRFALEVINFVAIMPRNRTTEVLGRQLLKSGTSIGANYREAARAESRDDFIHKIAICAKESAETQYWLELFLEGKLFNAEKCEVLRREASELLAMFIASGRTAKKSR
jgi:four helix bundle protein